MASRLFAASRFNSISSRFRGPARSGLSRGPTPARVLTHLPVIFGFQWLLAKAMLPVDGAPLASAAIVACLGVGFACHHGFERPVHRALMARLAERKAAAGPERAYAP